MIEQRALSTQIGSVQARRAPLDPSMRRKIFGPIRPMERPGLLERLFGH